MYALFMTAFIDVDGRKTISGDVVRVEVTHRSGEPTERTEAVLTNGRTVRVVYQNRQLRLFTGKGARSFPFTKGMVVRFIVDGTEAAVIRESDLENFIVIEG